MAINPSIKYVEHSKFDGLGKIAYITALSLSASATRYLNDLTGVNLGMLSIPQYQWPRQTVDSARILLGGDVVQSFRTQAIAPCLPCNPAYADGLEYA